MNRARLGGLGVPLVAALMTGAVTLAAGDARQPTAAFLDVSRKPIGALVEQRLLKCPNALWLERTEIEQVLRERALTSLFSPAACAERAAVGRILKADLLILLEHVAQPAEHARLVVCETTRGLRLASHLVPLSQKTEEDAAKLASLGEQTITRYGEQVREICAVPPFVSRDLTYDYDYLKSAYARLVEQTIRDRPGLLTVELEEAQAIGKEVGLAGSEVRRDLPLYLLGEFRHEGKGEERTVAIRLQVMRGENTLGERSAEALSPEQATQVVKRSAAELIENTIGLRQVQPNAQLEAEQLAQRAEAFHQVGDWIEAAALAEASLLLDGKQSRMHRVAASALAALARSDTIYLRDNRPDRVERGLRRYFRALEHYERLLPEVQNLNVDGLYDRLYFAVSWGNLTNVHSDAPEIRRLAGELRERELEILLRMVRARLRTSADDEYRLADHALRSRPQEEQIDILLKIVPAIPDQPGAAERVRRITLRGYWVGLVINTPAGRRYIERLKAMGSAEVRQAALDMEREAALSLEEWLALGENAESRPPRKRGNAVPDRTAPKTVRFEPIPLVPPDERPQRRFWVSDWLPAGPSTDLISHRSAVFVMKEPDRPKLIWTPGLHERVPFLITSFGYDGQFAWITTHHHRAKPQLLILDPREERIWEVKEDAGLPVVSIESIPDRTIHQQLWVEPIEPGRALLVSWFGRISISIVNFDPATGAKVRTFFEARAARDPSNADAWRNVEMAFAPDHIYGFHGASPDGKPMHRVVVGGRRPEYYEEHPLVVDPDSEEVKVASEPWRKPSTILLPDREPDAFFQVHPHQDMKLHLARVGLPDFRRQILVANVPGGACLKHGDKFVIAGSKWWLVDPAAPPDDRIRVLATELPWVYWNSTVAGASFVGESLSSGRLAARGGFLTDQSPPRLLGLFQSSHYGTIAACGGSTATKFYRVVFEDAER